MGITGLHTPHLGCTLGFIAPPPQNWQSKLVTAANYWLLPCHNKGAKHKATLLCESCKLRGKRMLYDNTAPQTFTLLKAQLNVQYSHTVILKNLY